MSLYREIELPLAVVLRSMEDVGVGSTRIAWARSRRGSPIRSRSSRRGPRSSPGRSSSSGSTQQVARILFETLGPRAGAEGQDRVLDRQQGPARPSRRRIRSCPVIEEWREYSKLLNTYLGPLPELISPEDGRLHTTFNQTVAATGRLSTSNPNLQSIPIRTELGRSIRSAFVAEPGCEASLGRLLAGRAADPRARLRRAEAARGVPAGRRRPCGDGRRGARARSRRRSRRTSATGRRR